MSLMIRSVLSSILVITAILINIALADMPNGLADSSDRINNTTELATEEIRQVKDEASYQLLAHPLFAAGIGGIITAIIVPRITRKWQDRQKEISIKSDLVQKISESVTNFIESMSFRFVVKDIPQKEKENEKAFREWRAKSAVIGAELRAYFIGSKIVSEWNEVYYATNDFFFLFEGLDKQNSLSHYNDLKEYAEKKLDEKKSVMKNSMSEFSEIDWDLIKKECVDNKLIDFSNKNLRKSWELLGNMINDDKYKLIIKILQEKVYGFSRKIGRNQDEDRLTGDTRTT